jgi:hypothetical protein
MIFGNTSMTDILRHHRTTKTVDRFSVALDDLSSCDGLPFGHAMRDRAFFRPPVLVHSPVTRYAIMQAMASHLSDIGPEPKFRIHNLH